MQAIKPLSAGTDIAQTPANFPCCELALTYENFNHKNTGLTLNSSTTGLGTITDSEFSGVTVTLTGNDKWADENGSYINATASASSHTGTMPNIGTKDVIFLACKDNADAAAMLELGAPVTSLGAALGGDAAFYGLTNTGATHFTTAVNPSTMVNEVLGMYAISYKQDGTTQQHLYDGANDVYEVDTQVETTDMSGIDWDMSVLDNLVMPSNMSIRDYYIFSFDTLPSDDFIKSMIAWMYANPSKIYPGLKDVI